MEKGKEQKHDQPKKYNLLLLGDSNVGKTSIFMKYTQNEFKGNYNSSIGIDFQVKNINYKDKNYSLHIYDTAGQERFRGITKSYYRLAQGFFIVFDLTNKNSLNSVKDWIDRVKEEVKDFKLIILGNKDDLKKKHIDELEINDVLNDFNDIKFIRVSAKDGKNITKAFNEMIDLLDEDNQEKNDIENKDESGKKNKGTKLKNKKSNLNKKCC